jgi:hypothetical protein
MIPFINKPKCRKSEHQKIIAKVDRVFSLLVRHTFSQQGVCFCYICGRPYSILKIDNGHCIPRAKEKTRYDINNCRPQCKKCNRFRGEESKIIFEEKLRKELPEGLFDKMKSDSKFIFKYEDFELQALYKEFSTKLKELQK